MAVANIPKMTLVIASVELDKAEGDMSGGEVVRREDAERGELSIYEGRRSIARGSHFFHEWNVVGFVHKSATEDGLGEEG